MSDFLSAFDRQCRQRPGAVALVHDARTATYAELDRLSDALAARLVARGVVRGGSVALMAERSIDAIAAMLAILRVGGAFVPIDPTFPADRIDYMLRDASVSCIVADARPADGVPGSALPLVELSRVEPKGAAAARPERIDPAPSQRAYIMYTSGSTGRPKGVAISHAALDCYCRADVQAFEVSAADRTLQFATLSFDICIEELFPPLSVGGTVVLRPSRRSDAQIELSDIIERFAVTAVHLATGYWHEWVDLMASAGARVPPSLRLMVVTGEKVSPEHYTRWLSLCRHRTLWANAYGPTETTVSATVFIPPAGWRGRAMPIGRPLPGYSAHILDEAGRPVDAGRTGELHIGGGALAEGYLNRPDQSAAAFIADPFSAREGARLYRTGDLARWLDDGNIDYAGRIDHQIKVGSYRIEPGEIENAINGCPGVAESLVGLAGRSGAAQLIAYVASADPGLRPEGIAAHLERHLPVWMMPARYLMIERFAKTANGKIDRAALPDAAAAAAPGRADRVAPTTDTERALCRIWSEVLGGVDVGIDDSFISLGGDSLMAVRAIARIQRRLGVTVSTRDFFFLDSVALLAGHLNGEGVARRVPPPVPAFVDARARQLYTLLQRPMPGNDNGHGVLLVPPLGNEQRRVQRPFRSLMQNLSRRGHTVLRFDWRGTGDSSGEAEWLTGLEPWMEDLHDAAALLAGQVNALDLVAVRAGALIAARTPLAGLPVDQRFYWDPVPCAQRWLEQMQALHRDILADTFRFLRPRRPDAENDVVEFAGLRLHASLCESLARESLVDSLLSHPWNRRAHLLLPEALRDESGLVEAARSGTGITALDEDNDWLDPRATTRDMLITQGAGRLVERMMPGRLPLPADRRVAG